MASEIRPNITTMYASISEDDLYCLFTEKKWSALDEQKRLAVLQEVECRMAKKQGRPVCLIHAKPMDANSLGNFDGECINLNSNLLRSPRTLFGKIRPYGGITALDTVIHEGRHAFQRAVVCGKSTVKVPDKVRRAWAINTVGYMNGKTAAAFAFYSFQPLERDAREYAAKALSGIYRRVVRATGGSDVLFEKGLEQLRKEKEMEFKIARAALTEKMMGEQIDILKARIALCSMVNIPIPVFGETVSVKDCFKECGISSDMVDGLIDEQLKDHRAIVRGEKGLDEYMDGLLGDSVDNDIVSVDSPDSSPDNNPPSETLDQLVARLLGKPVKEGSFSESSKVRPDGSKHRF